MTNPHDDDAELLRRYAGEDSEAAFAELTRRHVGFVYAAALRQLDGAAHRAEEVTQGVFIDLARKASILSRRTEIMGWLYTSTHHAAAKLKRDEQRRQRREQEAHTMQEMLSNPAADHTDWDRLRPVLDSAMHELGERDRAVILLRFFQGCRFAEVGQKLGLSEDGARMRTERALEKLHGLLARRQITSTTAALGLLLANQPVVAVPAGLTASVTGAALAGAAASGGSAMTGLIFSFMKLKTGVIAALIAAGLGLGITIHQRRETSPGPTATAVIARERQPSREPAPKPQSAPTRAPERGTPAGEQKRAGLSNLAEATAGGPAVLTNDDGSPVVPAANGTVTFSTVSPDPVEQRQRIRATNGQNVDEGYASLYQKLNWTAEQREQFKTMILDCEESGSLLMKRVVEVARAKNPTLDRAERFEIFEAIQAQIQAEQQAEARRLFGAAAGDAVEYFQATQPMRFVVRQLTDERFQGSPPLTMPPLTTAQADQLIELMANHARGTVAKVDLMALDLEAVVTQARAQGLMTPEQLAVLRTEVTRAQIQQKAQRAQNTMPIAELKAKQGK
jgi:RNA polymerase sigma factor (sigma-70 family)